MANGGRKGHHPPQTRMLNWFYHDKSKPALESSQRLGKVRGRRGMLGASGEKNWHFIDAARGHYPIGMNDTITKLTSPQQYYFLTSQTTKQFS